MAAGDTYRRLIGIPIGVKDIFDTVDYPTEFFSPLYAGNRPTRDAYVVARLKHAGGIVMGKTHTAEFACYHTGPTRNPRDHRRTPGSSSAGSAAGIAAGFFPLALGTQTAGSLLKPAAYCGVYGFKPSFGLVSLEGAKPVAPSFDTAGWFGRSARDLELLASILIVGLPRVDLDLRQARIGFCRPSHLGHTESDVASRIEQAVDRISAAKYVVREFDLPTSFDSVCADHQLIVDCETRRSLQGEADRGVESLSGELRSILERSESITWAQESEAKQRISALSMSIADVFASFDVILTASCGIVAPVGLSFTGPSDHIKFWTAFGLPQANIPLTAETGMLPVGLQVIGSFRNDRLLLRVTRLLASVLYP
jgi:Asp-tRNA(Asn)/Glu-tRNA(Gln) amidotransferase A subunit family amidase